jgi:AcrR family transcriptional regulator
VSEPKLRDLKRDETRQRLLDAGVALFAERGYDATTTAEIAAAAGVTERTFFRHFPAKSDLILANWRRFSADVDAAMAAMPAGTPVIEVIRAGLLAFATALAAGVDQEPQRSILVFSEQVPLLRMLEILLALESSIATELAGRLGLPEEDLDVRIIATTSIGVLRAASRAYVQPGGREAPLPDTVSDRLDQFGSVFHALEQRALTAPVR